MSRIPAVFSGHGSPMIALEDNEITKSMRAVGDAVIAKHGKPKAILAISGHWFVGGTCIQSAEKPKQVFDMYGFPKELYEVKYPVSGSRELTDAVLAALGDDVAVNDEWGIDHGTWTVLVHMFPDADIPVVQLSVNGYLDAQKSYEIGRKLSALRDAGFMIFGSGNVVHNLRRVEWDNPDGTDAAHRFNNYIADAVLQRDDTKVIHFENGPDAAYAVPTPDHFLPLLYVLGASEGEKPVVFNNICNLGSVAMTGFAFGL